ncbi:unnamed protein product [Arabidopsis lyrata]|nr:unnamed protein product [Arabidopsis lyrata]
MRDRLTTDHQICTAANLIYIENHSNSTTFKPAGSIANAIVFVVLVVVANAIVFVVLGVFVVQVFNIVVVTQRRKLSQNHNHNMFSPKQAFPSFINSITS